MAAGAQLDKSNPGSEGGSAGGLQEQTRPGAGRGPAAAQGSGAAGMLAGYWNQGAARWAGMAPRQRNWLTTVAILLLATIVGLAWYAARTDWRTLYAGLDPEDSRQMAQVLTQAQIPFDLSAMSSVAEVVCRELTSAWQPVGLSFNFERRHMQTQTARIMPVTEKTLCLSFEVRMAKSSGLLNLAFPAVVANTILRRLSGEWGGRRRHAVESRARVEQAARELIFGTALQLPAVRVEARDLEELTVGKLIRLKLAANTSAELRAGGQLLFHAQPVRLGPHRGAKLESAAKALAER